MLFIWHIVVNVVLNALLFWRLLAYIFAFTFALESNVELPDTDKDCAAINGWFEWF